MAAGSIPNRANDPKRKAGLYTPGQIARGEHKAPTPFVPKSAPVRPRSLSEQAPMAKTSKQIHEAERRPNQDLYKNTRGGIYRSNEVPNRDIYKKQPPKL